jgi:hypothetical protein
MDGMTTCAAYGCCEPIFTRDGYCVQHGATTRAMRLFLYGPGGGFDHARKSWARDEARRSPQPQPPIHDERA